MPAFTFEEARRCVLEKAAERAPLTPEESVVLEAAAGGCWPSRGGADRDYPAVARSVPFDGYAVRATDLPGGGLEVVGEVRAGESFGGEVGARQKFAPDEPRSGPTSPPALLTAWQVMQFRPLRRKTASPRTGSPLAATSATRPLSSSGVGGLTSVVMPGAAQHPYQGAVPPGPAYRRHAGRAWPHRPGSCAVPIAPARTCRPLAG